MTVVGNMEVDTMKANQNGVLRIAEKGAAEQINDESKRSRKLTENC